MEDSDWANFGQGKTTFIAFQKKLLLKGGVIGAPEVGHIPGASERPKTINLEEMGDEVNE